MLTVYDDTEHMDREMFGYTHCDDICSAQHTHVGFEVVDHSRSIRKALP